MSSASTDRSTSSNRRIAILALTVFVSIAVPMGIVVQSVSTALSGRPLGFPSTESKSYQGGLKNGELWFIVRHIDTMTIASRLKRLDLQTGLELEAGGPTNDGIASISIADELYLAGSHAIYKLRNSSLEPVGPLPARPASSRLNSTPFVYDGQLTAVAETSEGGYRLIHLKDRRWLDGRKILLPGFGRVWRDDLRHNHRTLLPLTSQQPTPNQLNASTNIRRSAYASLKVIQERQRTHLFLTDYMGFCAYRRGFEFESEPTDCASALIPENSPPEVSGWEPIAGTEDDGWFGSCPSMACDQNGPLFVVSSRNPDSLSLVRRGKEDEAIWTASNVPQNIMREGYVFPLANPSESTAYLVTGDSLWSSAIFRRIEGNTVCPAQLSLPGFKREYAARLQQMSLGLALAWLLHLAILVVGTVWLDRGRNIVHYQFGMDRVSLASAWRRAFAWGIDAMLIIGLLLLADGRTLGVLFDWTKSTEEISRSLLQYEKNISNDLPSNDILATTINVIGNQVIITPFHFACLIVLAVVFVGLKVTTERLVGTTPGKWLFGIRALTSTLRPCGLAQTMVRETLCCIEFPLLITPIPAVIAMILSQCRQRLGDRFADTIVVNSHSLRDRERQPTEFCRVLPINSNPTTKLMQVPH